MQLHTLQLKQPERAHELAVKAIAVCKANLKFHERNWKMWFNLAVAHSFNGEQDEAVRLYVVRFFVVCVVFCFFVSV
jgi:hypothetical protein